MCQYNWCNVAAQNVYSIVLPVRHALMSAYNPHFAFFTIRNSANKIYYSRPIPLLMPYAVTHARILSTGVHARGRACSAALSWHRHQRCQYETNQPISHRSLIEPSFCISHDTIAKQENVRSQQIDYYHFLLFFFRIQREPRVKTHYKSQWCAWLCRSKWSTGTTTRQWSSFQLSAQRKHAKTIGHS